ncbi:MAG: response regulator transcription factor, partial [Planctomycetes bacterium]|nr:response regulator transcription factor [Planctomycetota bacterium]
MDNGKIRVIIVDDHELLRSGIKVLFKRASEIEVVGEASTGGVGMKLVSELLPGGCEINCVNGHRFVNLLLKGTYYGQT